jgi:hypothetical protein
MRPFCNFCACPGPSSLFVADSNTANLLSLNYQYSLLSRISKAGNPGNHIKELPLTPPNTAKLAVDNSDNIHRRMHTQSFLYKSDQSSPQEDNEQISPDAAQRTIYYNRGGLTKFYKGFTSTRPCTLQFGPTYGY